MASPESSSDDGKRVMACSKRYAGRASEDSTTPLIQPEKFFEIKVTVIAEHPGFRDEHYSINEHNVNALYLKRPGAKGKLPGEFREDFKGWTYVFVPERELLESQRCRCVSGEDMKCTTGYCYIQENPRGSQVAQSKCAKVPGCEGHRYMGKKIGGCIQGYSNSQGENPCRLMFLGPHGTSVKFDPEG